MLPEEPIAAIKANDLTKFTEWLQAHKEQINDADPNGLTLIFHAINAKQLPFLAALTAAGADVNQAGTDGYIPLTIAAFDGYYEAITYLLAKGAKVNAANMYGWTPLFAAMKDGDERIVRALLAAGASVDVVDEDGSMKCAHSLRPILAQS